MINRRRWAALAIAAGLMSMTAAARPADTSPATPESRAETLPPPLQLRVLTFNIHHAEGVDGRIDVVRIADLIRASKAEIVSLQEVDRGVERSARRDLLKEIADLTGMHFAFGKNLDHQGGDYGNALLTSLPIVSEGNRLLPSKSGGEQRGVLQVVVEFRGTRLLVLTTHLDHRRPDGDRLTGADVMLSAIAAWGHGPVIAMGDFNDTPDSATWKRLTTVLEDAWNLAGKGSGFTIPVDAPSRRIDWILVRGFGAREIEVLRSDASDHLPVVATLELW